VSLQGAGGRIMAKKSLMKIKVLKTEKSQDEKQIQKGFVHRLLIEKSEEMSVNSKVGLENYIGKEVEVVAEEGSFDNDEGKRINFCKILETRK
jgi:hypothetical protein